MLVIGAGAAGFFCAVNAARLHPGWQVIIVEKSNKLLSKVRVSGGGRCNVTHDCSHIPELLKFYPRGGSFLKKAFRQFFCPDTIAWFSARGVALKTEPDGRMFPVSDQSQTIIDCLLGEANTYGVKVHMREDVQAVKALPGGGFRVLTGSGREWEADRVCVTVGGYSRPEQYHWLTALGHSFVKPVPSLFTFNMPRHELTTLMGVTVPHVQVRIKGTKWQQEGPLLITHWGLSGPAVLKLSAWAARDLAASNYHFQVQVNWVPAYHENSMLEALQQVRFTHASQKIVNRNPFQLPARLWEFILVQTGIRADIRWADLPAKEQHKLAKALCAQEYPISGKTTFKEEFVTAGGIPLNEIDPGNMQSRICPGLYFAGEIMDVDGVTGGFNFQHAWTSGWIAAQQNMHPSQDLTAH